MKIRSGVLLALVLAATGCDEGLEPSDGGGTDASWADAGPTHQGDGGGLTDAGAVDECAAGCAGDEACVRGVCIDHCDADTAEWDEVLEAGLIPVRNHCRPAAARAIVAGSAPTVYEVVPQADAVTIELRRWRLDDPEAEPEVVASVTMEPPAGDAMPSVNGYLALSDTEALFGYLTFVSFTEMPGEVFRVNLESGTVERYEAPGNFDAAWLGENFVVNGLGLGDVDGDQGLYAYSVSEGRAVQVGGGLGSASGSVLVEDEYVLAGGLDATPVLYAVPRMEIEDALASGATLDLSAVGAAPEGATIGSMFHVPGPDSIGTRDYGGPLRVWHRAWSDSTLTLSDERVIASDSSYFSAARFVDDAILIEHMDGILVVAAGD